jgi:superfamily II DNA/RNA helicase
MLQRNRPHIVVGTAQGLIELLTMRVLAQGGTLRMLVLDEADVMVSSNQLDLLMHLMRLLPMPSPSASAGFDPWADTMKPPERQTAIFGAVIHPELLNFASALQLKEPVRVLVKKAATNSTVDSPQIAGPSPGAEVALLKNMKHHYLYVAIASRPQGGKRASSAEAWKVGRADLCLPSVVTHVVARSGR